MTSYLIPFEDPRDDGFVISLSSNTYKLLVRRWRESLHKNDGVKGKEWSVILRTKETDLYVTTLLMRAAFSREGIRLVSEKKVPCLSLSGAVITKEWIAARML